MEQKNNNRNSSESTETRIYLTPDSTLQTPEEDAQDKSNSPGKDDTVNVSNDDLHETDADRFAGSDRAGSAERKDNCMKEDENV